MPEQHSRTSNRWITAALVAALVAIFAVSLVLAPRGNAPEGEAFGGTDAKAVQIMEEHGAEQWFTPLFEPGSGEVESGLFALQAALGAGVLGYVLGNLNGRRAWRRADSEQGAAEPATDEFGGAKR